MNKHTFSDRRDAGRQLAKALPSLDPGNTVVIALPRGGVPVAEEICSRFHIPLDLVFVRKIGAPRQPELALGAIVDGDDPHVVVNPLIARASGLTEAEVTEMGQELIPEIEHRRNLYLGGRRRPDLIGKTVVVVDDGVATGATMRASLMALHESGAAQIILALPVAPRDVLPELAALADKTICLKQPQWFHAVGATYRSFPQTTDQEVITALQRCAEWQQRV